MSVSVLRVRDKDGNIIEIPAIKGDKGDKGIQGPEGPQGIQGPKGDKGDAYVLTEADKKEIAEQASKLVDIPEIGESITVDDTLSDTSTNPVQNKVITAQLQSLLNIDYNELAFDTTEIVVNSINATSVLGQAILGQMVLA